MSATEYIFKRIDGDAGAPLLFLFHGTGGDENQLLGLGQQLMPGAPLVSPRGDVSEQGAARFFRRTGEGMWLPASNLALIVGQCCLRWSLNSAQPMPSTPAAPLFLITR